MKNSANQRICGCSFIRPNQTLREGLELAKSFGFENVDIAVGGGNAHFDIVEVAQNPARFADEVRRESERLQLQINECFALNFGAPINSPDATTRKQTRELFRGLCDFASRAGFKSVMLIAGPQHEGAGREYSRFQAASALNELVEIASKNNLLLNLEADCDSCVSTPEEARELCERVPHLGLTLDHSHFICQGISPQCIEILYPLARHVHVRQSAPSHIVTPVENGVVDFLDVLQKLKACGYDGLFCVEYLALTPDETARENAETRTRAIKKQMLEVLEKENL
jgi:sugar phosphate isomerase/epimerase